MTEYNEYVNTVKARLKKYNIFKATIESLSCDIHAKESILEKAISLGAPIAMYDNMPKGGSGELTTVERQAEERMMIRMDIDRAKYNLAETEFILGQLDRAMGALPQEDQFLLRGHYIDGRDWKVLGYELHYTERWARKKASRAIKTMTIIIFGPKACPDDTIWAFVRR